MSVSFLFETVMIIDDMFCTKGKDLLLFIFVKTLIHLFIRFVTKQFIKAVKAMDSKQVERFTHTLVTILIFEKSESENYPFERGDEK